MKKATLSPQGGWTLLLPTLLGILLLSAGAARGKENVIVFHAGSLTVPLAAMEKAFEAAHPEIDILREAGGSTKLARMITELHKPADIMVSADYLVIDKALIPAYADWNIRFATNQLVLCYTPRSRFADEVRSDNWYEILARPGVVWGHSDPNLDPCGYRSLMVLQLAEKFYAKPGLYDRLIANRPEANVRPKSVELVSLLETGNMDFAWEYLSVAVQHGLQFVRLDAHINLSNSQLDDFYRQAAVEVTGSQPGTRVTEIGQSCTYGLTLVKGAPNAAGAVLFLEYLLSPEGGLKILESLGQPPLIPARVDSAQVRQQLPGNLGTLVEVSK